MSGIVQPPVGAHQYLTGIVAIDVARMTGLQLKSPKHALDEDGDIAWDAVPPQLTDRVFLDLGRMPWWDRFRVAWTLIGGHHYLKENPA